MLSKQMAIRFQATLKKWWWVFLILSLSAVILFALLKSQHRINEMDNKLNKISFNQNNQNEKNTFLSTLFPTL